MTTKDYFRRRRELRFAWNALTRAADVPDPLRALDAIRDALSWLAAGDGSPPQREPSAEWIAKRGSEAGVAASDIEVLRAVLREKDVALGQDAVASRMRDAIPSVWRLLEFERNSLARACPPSAVAILALRTVLSLFLIAAVAAGTTYGLMRLRDMVRPNGFWVTYYADGELKRRAATRIEPVIFKDYGNRPPVFGLRARTWSSRWESRLKVDEPGDYMFITKSQDGVRLYIDDKLLVDNWREQDWNNSLRKVACPLGEGVHTVRVEHVVYRGNGAIQVQWVGGRVKERTDLGGKGVMRPSLRECRR